MILSTPSGDREFRLFDASAFIPHPGSDDAVWEGSVKMPALAVPAVAAAVRLCAEEIASMVMRVYSGDAQLRQPVLGAPQARLFQEPAEGWTSFDLWSDTVTALELERHAFIWKLKTTAGVEEIYPIDPDFCRVLRVGGEKRVEAWIEGKKRDVTADVIHIRAWSAKAGSVNGNATPEIHTRALRTASDYEEYCGRWFANNGTPGLYLEHPGSPDKTQRRDLLEGWVKRHGGARNTNKPGIVWGGVKVNALGSSLKDAQAHEISDSLVRNVARMWRIYPVQLLHAVVTGTPPTPEMVSDIFLRFSLLHRMRRIERALAVDRDLFPRPSRYPRFDVSEFLRGDIATTATMAHNLVQVGVMTKNEARATLGLPPIEGGDEILQTPVGGAPNDAPLPFPGTSPADDPEPVSATGDD